MPGSIIRTLPNECPEAPEEWDSIMSDINDVIMPGDSPATLAALLARDASCNLNHSGAPYPAGVTHWQSPSFFGYFPANSSAPGMLGEMLSAALNVIGFSWIGSPAATELEQVAMDMLASLIGLPDTFKCRCVALAPLQSAETPSRVVTSLPRSASSPSPRSSGTGGGVIQGTASEAALVAMLAARARILGPPPASSPEAPPETLRDITLGGSRELALVAYASDQAHSCVRKACMVAGVRHYRSVPTREEDGWAMTGAALKRAVEADMARGLTPAFVCCTLGTTGCGSVDRIAECAEVAQVTVHGGEVRRGHSGDCSGLLSVQRPPQRIASLCRWLCSCRCGLLYPQSTGCASRVAEVQDMAARGRCIRRRRHGCARDEVGDGGGGKGRQLRHEPAQVDARQL